MGAAAVVGYALAGVLRARRRSAFALVGLALAIATIATPAVALDSEVRALVDRYAALLPYDYHAVGKTADFVAAAAAAQSVGGVIGAEPIALPILGTTFASRVDANATPANITPIDIAFVRPSFDRISARFGFTGSFALSPTEVAVADRIASRLRLTQGDPIQLVNFAVVCTVRPFECHNETRTENVTIGSVLATPLAPPPSPYLDLPVGSPERNAMVFASFDAVDAMRNQLYLGIEDPPRLAILVWADRTALIDPFSAATTETRVLHLERELAAILVPWALAVDVARTAAGGTNLVDLVGQVDDATALQRGLFLLLSVPAAALGFLFSRMGFEAGLARRRREIGVLRSRGFSVPQIVSHLLVEVAILGTFGAIAGLAIALLVSRAFLSVVVASFPGGLDLPFSDVAVSPLSAILSVAAGIGIAFVAAYPAVRRAASVRIVRALHTTNPVETAVEYSQARSFLSIAVGAAGLLLILGYQGVTAQAGLLTFLFGATLSVLIVLAPILLILGLARYVTLGTDRPYRALARLVRRWTGDLYFLVAEGLRRDPKRSSTLAVIVAFSLAFAIFVVGLGGIVQGNEERIARTAVGGDLFLDAKEVDRSNLEAIGTMPGAAAVSVADFILASLGTLVALNTSSYLGVAPWLDDYYFLEGTAAAVRSLVPDRGAIANAEIADALRLHVGDPLVFTVLSGRSQLTVVLRVVGVVRALPGLQPSGGPTDGTPTLFVDVRSLVAQNVTVYPTTGRRAIVTLHAGTDPHAFARTLEDAWAGHATVYDDVLAALRSDPFRASLLGHLATQAGLAVLIMVLALTLTAFASAVEREGEFATMVARGLDRRGIAALLFGEGLTVGLLGSLLAAPVVLVFLWEFLRLFEAARPSLLPMEFLVPPTAWLLMAAALGTVAVGTLLAGVRLGRMNLPRVLKLRGM